MSDQPVTTETVSDSAGTGAPLRLAVLSTPRCGNTWLRRMLCSLYDIPGEAVHNPLDLDWNGLPRDFVLQLHWHRSPPFLARLAEHGFRVVVLARHPLDCLLSILHFALHDPTARWLEGEGGNERPIFGAMPRSTAFLEYATGSRAAALLSISREWWTAPEALRVRYEALCADPGAEMERLVAELGVPPRRPVVEVTRETTFARMRQLTGSPHHCWMGQPGLWKSLFPEAEASFIARAHKETLGALGYSCDPDFLLEGRQADARWIGLVWEGLSTSLHELQKTRQAVKESGTHLDWHKEQLRVVTGQLEAVRAETAPLLSQLDAARWEASQLRIQLEASRGECGQLRDQFAGLQSELSQVRSQLITFQAESGPLREQLDAACWEASQLRIQLKESQAEAAQARGQVAAVQVEVEKLREDNRQLDAARWEASQLRLQLEASQAEAARAYGEVERLREESVQLDAARREAGQLRLQRDEAQAALQESESLRAQLREAREEAGQRQGRLEELQGEMQQVRERLHAAQGEVWQLQARMETMQEETQNLRGRLLSTQEGLTASKDKLRRTEEAFRDTMEKLLSLEGLGPSALRLARWFHATSTAHPILRGVFKKILFIKNKPADDARAREAA